MYKIPFLIYAVMNGKELLHKIETVRDPGWTVDCIDLSYTSRCEVFVPPKSERIACKTLEALSGDTVTVDCHGRYE